MIFNSFQCFGGVAREYYAITKYALVTDNTQSSYMCRKRF